MLPNSIVSCSLSWVILVPLSNINGIDYCIPHMNVLGGGVLWFSRRYITDMNFLNEFLFLNCIQVYMTLIQLYIK